MNPVDRHLSGSPDKFRLDREGGKALGVCQGLANYTGIDPMIVRAVFVLGTLFGFGSFVLVYFVIALLAD